MVAEMKVQPSKSLKDMVKGWESRYSIKVRNMVTGPRLPASAPSLTSYVTQGKLLILSVLSFFICKMGVLAVPTSHSCVRMK